MIEKTIDEKLALLYGSHKAVKQEVLTVEELKSKTRSRNAESDLQTKICKWINREFPGTLFISDFAAGLFLSPFLANLRASQSCGDKYPDLTILEPRGGYFGLIIEIKTDKGTPFKVDGVSLLKNEHTQGQNQVLERMRTLGYLAHFGVGEDQIKRMVVKYKSMPLTKQQTL